MSTHTDRMIFSDAPPPRKTLGQLSEEWGDLLHAIAENDGEITPENEAQLVALQKLLGESVDRIGHVLKSLGLQALGHRERADYHLRAARARETAHQRLKDYLAAVMVSMNVKRLEGADFTGYLRETMAVVIHSEHLLPEECWRIVREIDKKGIGEAIKAGKEIPGAEMARKLSAHVR